MRRLVTAVFLLAVLGACGGTSGVLVSSGAVPIGGNLFIEDAPGGGQVLVLDGEITPRTSYTFLSLIEQAEVDGLVIAQSPGGDLLAAHQMGRAIREKRINTAVIAVCSSACVDVFIAGTHRAMAEGSELGLHAADDREFGYSVDKPYWTALGFGAVNERAYQVPRGKFWVIPAEQALRMRLATEIWRDEG